MLKAAGNYRKAKLSNTRRSPILGNPTCLDIRERLIALVPGFGYHANHLYEANHRTENDAA